MIKAILQKAIDNGWETKINPNNIIYILHGEEIQEDDKDGGYNVWTIDKIIFSHDFCKAFFGNTDVCDKCGKSYLGNQCEECRNCWTITEWKWEIQQLVLSEDRIKYLEQFL